MNRQREGERTHLRRWLVGLALVVAGSGAPAHSADATGHAPLVAAVPANPLRAEAELDGVRLTVTLARTHVAEGEVLFATATVENHSPYARFWRSTGDGDCHWATHLQVEPVAPLERGRGWWGDLRRLKRSLLGIWGVPRHQLETPHWFVAADRLPHLSTGCFAVLGAAELPPGDSRIDLLAWRPTGPLGMPLPPGAYEITARFKRVTGGGSPMPIAESVSLTMPIEIVGPPIAYTHPGIAVDAALRDARFRAHLAAVRPERWFLRSLEFEEGTWTIAVKIGRPSAWREVMYTVVVEVDARTGVVRTITPSEPPPE